MKKGSHELDHAKKQLDNEELALVDLLREDKKCF